MRGNPFPPLRPEGRLAQQFERWCESQWDLFPRAPHPARNYSGNEPDFQWGCCSRVLGVLGNNPHMSRTNRRTFFPFRELSLQHACRLRLASTAASGRLIPCFLPCYSVAATKTCCPTLNSLDSSVLRPPIDSYIPTPYLGLGSFDLASTRPQTNRPTDACREPPRPECNRTTRLEPLRRANRLRALASSTENTYYLWPLPLRLECYGLVVPDAPRRPSSPALHLLRVASHCSHHSADRSPSPPVE